jgi:hypothetical protein
MVLIIKENNTITIELIMLYEKEILVGTSTNNILGSTNPSEHRSIIVIVGSTEMLRG